MSKKQKFSIHELAIEQMKLEIAHELGIPLPADGYYGHISTKEIGTIGGNLTKRLALLREQSLNSGM
ncbi:MULTISPECIES: alpha/beta-type small acid-soluble spore protein [Paenibacillus]|uniref:alpha/beta-type small acid-soluble spore protein n=1 Tax=Paenibacillus TaxID=44249 RepID=UPI00203D14C7|nr:alpha/beta-type small acid-soluble spore protein [Paenibacillus camelliae]MCM3635381.1 alpha/beta-type small acid-soluble spore protein [Paenibacillus camelliae]